jgi:quercetin 2,3-dioxygenase
VLNAKLTVGESIEYSFREPRLAYLVPSTGTLDVNGVRVHARDGVAIKDVDIVTITAIEAGDVVMVDVL